MQDFLILVNEEKKRRVHRAHFESAPKKKERERERLENQWVKRKRH